MNICFYIRSTICGLEGDRPLNMLINDTRVEHLMLKCVEEMQFFYECNKNSNFYTNRVINLISTIDGFSIETRIQNMNFTCIICQNEKEPLNFPIASKVISVNNFYKLLANLQDWANNPSYTGDKSKALIKILEAFQDGLDRLDLSNLQLNALPNAIWELTNLTKMDLRGNCICSLPDDIGNLKELMILDLTANKLTHLPYELRTLTNLEVLSLGDNDLRDLPDEIYCLKNLTELHLDYNNLTFLPESIINLEKLKKLFLNNNHFYKFPVVVYDLKSLTDLCFENNPYNIGGIIYFPQDLQDNLVDETTISASELEKSLQEWLDDPLVTGMKQEAALRIKKTFTAKICYLDLSNLNLDNPPSILWKLTYLTHLDLSCNSIKKLPAELNQLKSLISLNVSGNQLESLPNEIGELSFLRGLDLSDNKLEILPGFIGQLENLRGLSIKNNLLKILPEEIGLLRNLIHLHLKNNILEIVPKEIGLLSELQYLDLNNNKLSDLPVEISALKNLEYLHLSNYNDSGMKTEPLPKVIGELTNLKNIDISGLGLTNVPSWIGNLTKLENIHLDDNQLITLPEEFVNLQELTEIFLDNNKFESLPLVICSMAKLEWLSLNDNSVLRELPMLMGQLEALLELETEGTGVSEAQRDAILDACVSKRAKKGELQLPSRMTTWFATAKFKNAEKILDSLIEHFASKERITLNEWLMRLERTQDFIKCQGQLSRIVCEMIIYLVDPSFDALQLTIPSEDEFQVMSPEMVEEMNMQGVSPQIFESKSIFLEKLVVNPFKEQFFNQVESNNSNCQDRAAMAFNELYVAWKIDKLPKTSNLKESLELMIQASKTLALRSSLAAQISQYEIDKKIETLESVEIFLYYETSLKTKLNLLTAINHMSYAEIGKREWIKEDQLIQDVERNYLNFLVELPCLETLIEKDDSFELLWSEKKQKFDNVILSLTEKLYPNPEEFPSLNLPSQSDPEKILHEKLNLEIEMNTKMKERNEAYMETIEEWIKLILQNKRKINAITGDFVKNNPSKKQKF